MASSRPDCSTDSKKVGQRVCIRRGCMRGCVSEGVSKDIRVASSRPDCSTDIYTSVYGGDCIMRGCVTDRLEGVSEGVLPDSRWVLSVSSWRKAALCTRYPKRCVRGCIRRCVKERVIGM